MKIGPPLSILPLAGALVALAGCGNASSHRESTRNQQEANTQAELKDLRPAEGDYKGTMTMLKSGASFDATLELDRVYVNARLSGSEDPTQTLNLPQLSGSMTFTLLEKTSVSDYKNYSDIINPMGGFSTVLFDYGDYDTHTHLLVLPYGVSGYNQGNFGELQGELKDGTFTGTWFAKPLGVVGKFSFVQTQGDSSDSSGESGLDLVVSKPVRINPASPARSKP